MCYIQKFSKILPFSFSYGTFLESSTVTSLSILCYDIKIYFKINKKPHLQQKFLKFNLKLFHYFFFFLLNLSILSRDALCQRRIFFHSVHPPTLSPFLSLLSPLHLYRSLSPFLYLSKMKNQFHLKKWASKFF